MIINHSCKTGSGLIGTAVFLPHETEKGMQVSDQQMLVMLLFLKHSWQVCILCEIQ